MKTWLKMLKEIVLIKQIPENLHDKENYCPSRYNKFEET